MSEDTPADAALPDRERFLAVFVSQQHRIFRFVCTLAPGRSDAEELFQETALVLWQRWSEFDPSRDFVPWACGIALNLVRNWRRKQTRRGPILSPEIVGQLADLRLRETESWDRLHAALTLCLEKLPAEQRSLLQECYGRGLSIKAVAEHSQRTPNVVYKLLAKIRQALYDCVLAHADVDLGLSSEGAS